MTQRHPDHAGGFSWIGHSGGGWRGIVIIILTMIVAAIVIIIFGEIECGSQCPPDSICSDESQQ